MRFAAVTLALLLAVSPSFAHHKQGHHIPPGHMKRLYQPDLVVPREIEFVCVVTTAVAGDPYAPIVRTAWLPRSDAERLADFGDSFIIYHPAVNHEDGCLAF